MMSVNLKARESLLKNSLVNETRRATVLEQPMQINKKLLALQNLQKGSRTSEMKKDAYLSINEQETDGMEQLRKLE